MLWACHRLGRLYFNPRAPRGARPAPGSAANHNGAISIHVPREGHDNSYHQDSKRLQDFNPRAPRGARRKNGRDQTHERDISIHVPREGHDCRQRQYHFSSAKISIHVPREGHDKYGMDSSTAFAISIHVPREGHDEQTQANKTTHG